MMQFFLLRAEVLSGSTVRDISSDMEGYLPTAVDSSPIIKKIAGVVDSATNFPPLNLFIIWRKQRSV